jgi:hypothetical protein
VQQKELRRPAEDVSALDRGNVLGGDSSGCDGASRVEPEQQRRQRKQRDEGDDGALDRAEGECARAADIIAEPRGARACGARASALARHFLGRDLAGFERVAAATVGVGHFDIGVRRLR